MSLEQDAEKFYEAMNNQSEEPEDQGVNPVCEKTAQAEELKDDESREDTMLCTQYSYNGPGFTPTSVTIPKLKAGVYSIEYINHMITFVPRPVKTDNLLRLPDSKSELVISQIEKFWDMKKVFSAYGFLHKRGFMLWGPPGSGKTGTLSIVMADMVKRGGVVIIVQDGGGFVAQALAKMRQVEPNRPLVVIMEDIDDLIRRNDEASFLSLMDGEMQIDNVVYIATTNYPERLDKRLTNRPSRFDLIVQIDMPSKDSRRIYLDNKLKDKDKIDNWVELTEGMSFAHIKELIVSVMCLGNDLDSEVKRLRKMMESMLSSDDYAKRRKMGLT